MNEIQKMKLQALGRKFRGAIKKLSECQILLTKIVEAGEAEHIQLSLEQILISNKERYETLVKEAKSMVAELPDNYDMG